MNQPAAQPQADVAGDCLLDVFHITPVEPVKAEGVWITAKDGRRYLDFYGGHAVALLGYGHPRLCATLDAQARTLFSNRTRWISPCVGAPPNVSSSSDRRNSPERSS